MPDEAIAGVTLDVYVAVSARALKLGLTAAETTALAAAHGVNEDAWAAASAGWRPRVAHDADVRAEYTRRYTQAAAK